MKFLINKNPINIHGKDFAKKIKQNINKPELDYMRLVEYFKNLKKQKILKNLEKNKKHVFNLYGKTTPELLKSIINYPKTLGNFLKNYEDIRKKILALGNLVTKATQVVDKKKKTIKSI